MYASIGSKLVLNEQAIGCKQQQLQMSAPYWNFGWGQDKNFTFTKLEIGDQIYKHRYSSDISGWL